jgi:hypothetical protein
MGTIPATGTEVAMGRISRALGLSTGYPPPTGSNIKLNGTLGINRGISASNVGNIVSGSQTEESSDFGGLDTPNNY